MKSILQKWRHEYANSGTLLRLLSDLTDNSGGCRGAADTMRAQACASGKKAIGAKCIAAAPCCVLKGLWPVAVRGYLKTEIAENKAYAFARCHPYPAFLPRGE